MSDDTNLDGGVSDEDSKEDAEKMLDDLSDEELLEEYYGCVHHLGICKAEGQIDTQQQNEEQVLREKILSRMSDE